ncbi:MAG: helix-turn-helix transcriptional regulator [bacterium]
MSDTKVSTNLEWYKKFVSQRIKDLRIAKELSRSELARALGVHRVRVVQMETTEPPLGNKILLGLCAVFDCTLIEFFSGFEIGVLLKNGDLQERIEKSIIKALQEEGITVKKRAISSLFSLQILSMLEIDYFLFFSNFSQKSS